MAAPSDTSGEAGGNPPGQSDTNAPPQISLPKGGGSILGMGEKFAANPVTGTGGMTIPIAVSPGRSGFGPQISLTYDSGSGNGPFGLGWSLGLPSITRRTDKGLPTYQDAEDSDIFMLAGNEDLVPVLAEDISGNWTPEAVASRNGYTIETYRPRIEGLFARIERWSNAPTGDCYWRSISNDNVTVYFGQTTESRVANPEDTSQIFSWLISSTEDDKGNQVVYSYVAEDSANIDLTEACERNRWTAGRSPANVYLSRIKYGNTQAVEIPASGAAQSWLFEIAFDYGEGYFTAAAPDENGQVFVTATMEPTGTWPQRQDCFSRYRSRFEMRTCRLCRRILTFHHFKQELGVEDCLVRSTEFTYDENPIATVLTAAVQSGYVLQGSQYLQASLPALEFEYSQAQVQTEVSEVDPESLINLPAEVDGSSYHWIDLDGEGLQCVLAERNNAWYYKRNLSPLSLLADNAQAAGKASFDLVTEVQQLPGFARQYPPRHQFMSLSANGHIDCAVLEHPGAGFYERTDEAGWKPFRSLDSVPNVNWSDPNLRFIDLDGDGFSDILITEQDSLTYYPSSAGKGFCAPVRLSKATDEEAGPAVIFADREKSIFLADMSGDGLGDIVRIRNGEVCYWPNLGYGRFGAKVNMDGAPWFDTIDAFDPARIRLADADGSGVIDILYLARDGVQLYLNQSGNRWALVGEQIPFPIATSLASIQALDLMGNGTACLVWSSSAPEDAGRSMRYVNLMGTVKPYLLTRSTNHLGAETRVTYTPSTAFYLSDLKAGTPWATRLPFPVQVVERVETYDWISRNRFVSRYTYHHGYFDATEREFRGFGMVEQQDTEELGILTQTGAFPDATNIDASSYVPPILKRTWFHTGAYPMGSRVTRIYDDEYWKEPGLSAAETTAALLPDSYIDASLTGEEIREALRSLKGSMLRQETYALDGTAAASLPYSVSENNYTVGRLQPFGQNRHAVFISCKRETLHLDYERCLYPVAGTQRCDPRSTHSMVLEVDDFFNEKKVAAIAYGRRYQDPDPLLTVADHTIQGQGLITYREKDYTNAILTQPDAYRTRMPAEIRAYELTNYTPTGIAGRFQMSDFVVPAATGYTLVFDSEIAYEATPTVGRQRRMVEQTRTMYRSDDLQTGLALGTVGSLALPFASYKLAFTPGLLTTVYQRPQAGGSTQTLLPSMADVVGGEGGYVLSDDQKALGLFPSSDPGGMWWIPGGRVFYSPHPGDSAAAELAEAQTNFFVHCRFQDIFQNNTIVTWDSYNLLPVQTEDPVQNIVRATNDYRVLQPALMADANGNSTTACFDGHGLVVASAQMDKSVTGPQDSIVGVVGDLQQAQIDAFFADPRGPLAAQLLGNATSRIVYDISRFQRSPSTPQAPLPCCSATILRETHTQNLSDGTPSLLQVSISYSDGLGRTIQKLAQADPGPLIPKGPVASSRWICSGWTIFNNKGKPVRQYEPFFADSSAFSFGITAGVSPTMFYDPAGRVVATLHPDHTWEKVVFDPWRQDSWDAGDTVLIADPSADTDVGSYFARIPASDYLPTWHGQRSSGGLGTDAQQAANNAEVFAGTFSTAQFDPLGRPFLAFAFNRSQLGGAPAVESHDRTVVAYDIVGNKRSTTDALGRMILTNDYDMVKSLIHQSSVDSGDRWVLNNALGKALLAWDSRDHQVQHDYDHANRPTNLWVQFGSQQPVLAEQNVYGESQPNAQAANLCGRIYQQFDAAGVVANQAYDFKGNPVSATRELLVDYQSQVDWSITPAPKLTGEIFTSSSTFDALNRPVALTSPDMSVIRPVYDEARALDQVNVNLQGAVAATNFVAEIDYDAKGQRTLIRFGNGSSTTYSYDPATYRLTNLNTVRSSDGAMLQALTYTYDPVGNVSYIADASQQTIYFSNQVVNPSSDYVYDALYRLLQAEGRELVGLANQPQTTWDDSDRMNQPLPLPSDAQALQNYTETYTYDTVGNILSRAHSAAVGGWTNNYSYDQPNVPPTNNRLTGTTIGLTTLAYTYDAHGNMTTMSHLPQMAWDFKDQLQATQSRVAASGAVETTYYVYDASGQRVRKVNQSAGGAMTDQRIYLGIFEIYREYDGSTDPSLERQTLHVMDDKQRIALVETLTVGDDGSPRQLIRYQFGNHLGSATLELNETAQIISYEEYYPYGSTSYQAVSSAIKAAAKRYRYTCLERDEETGLNYHGARYYALWLGRWTSCDPKGIAGSLNSYGYADDRPTMLVDLDGRDGTTLHLIQQTQHQIKPIATRGARGITDLQRSALRGMDHGFGPGTGLHWGHPKGQSFVTQPAGTRVPLSPEPASENLSKAHESKADKASAEAEGRFFRTDDIDPTVQKGTRFSQPDPQPFEAPFADYDAARSRPAPFLPESEAFQLPLPFNAITGAGSVGSEQLNLLPPQPPTPGPSPNPLKAPTPTPEPPPAAAAATPEPPPSVVTEEAVLVSSEATTASSMANLAKLEGALGILGVSLQVFTLVRDIYKESRGTDSGAIEIVPDHPYIYDVDKFIKSHPEYGKTENGIVFVPWS